MLEGCSLKSRAAIAETSLASFGAGMWPISQRVNSPKNDDEAILSHIEPDVFKFGARGPDAELPLT
jgi:hypothetical protein